MPLLRPQLHQIQGQPLQERLRKQESEKVHLLRKWENHQRQHQNCNHLLHLQEAHQDRKVHLLQQKSKILHDL